MQDLRHILPIEDTAWLHKDDAPSVRSWYPEVRRFVAKTACAVVVAALMIIMAAPVNCYAITTCAGSVETMKDMHRIIHCMLASGACMLFLRELVELWTNLQEVKDERSLMDAWLGSALICAVLGVLSVTQMLFACGMSIQHYAPPLQNGSEAVAIVHSLRYIEWFVNVPMLLVVSGMVALHRSWGEIQTTLFITNGYMFAAWLALVSDFGWLRIVLVIASFAGYLWASMKMSLWAYRFWNESSKSTLDRHLRVVCCFGQVAVFGVYGGVYLLAWSGAITSSAEHVSYGVLDVVVKWGTAVLLSTFRHVERQGVFQDLLKESAALNFGYTSVLSATFDVVLPCSIVSGSCRIAMAASELKRLTSITGVDASNACFEDLLFAEEDRLNFSSRLAHSDHFAMEQDIPTSRPEIAQLLTCAFKTQSTHPINLEIFVSAVHRSRQSEGPKVVVAVRLPLGAQLEPSDLSFPHPLPDAVQPASRTGRHGEEDKRSVSSFRTSRSGRSEGRPPRLPGSMSSGSSQTCGAHLAWKSSAERSRIASSCNSDVAFPGLRHRSGERLELSNLQVFDASSLSSHASGGDSGADGVVCSSSTSRRPKTPLAPSQPDTTSLCLSLSSLSLSAAAQTCGPASADVAVQTMSPDKPSIAEKNVETDLLWSDADLVCKSCQVKKPPLLPASQEIVPGPLARARARSASPQGRSFSPRRHSHNRQSTCPQVHINIAHNTAVDFSGEWLLVSDASGVSDFLASLSICGDDVVDGVGVRCKLEWARVALFEGGLLRLQGDKLVRVGKSGRELFFSRVREDRSDDDKSVGVDGSEGSTWTGGS